ncbi:uncharacterized protein B0I36DRAFT_355736 [Microdochium trichocladiopsis]|uniref:C2H2-type domain-containing protein n=1 Tax=Microdochium trichocladiopsis TaxID=1682393 RepID=A0A9P8XTZ6_9PEZI|nr:uncharacterized protein B0I36DRAFT_355736 [Microdochium trichocladiopsis]KAH7014541.1 hypothetical protein B0I36DRAFT_355736 [Microdochium trichocladiopsis]
MSLGSRSDKINQAIGDYVTRRLLPVYERLGEFGSTQAEIEAIELSMVRKSDGMFLYAKLVVDYLTHNIIYNTAEIMTSVNELPEKIVDLFLQSSSSTLRISSTEAALEHTQVVSSCLIHSIMSLPGTESYEKSLSVIKGLHGFLIYATEYWADYLQEYLLQVEPAKHDPSLFNLVEILEGQLAKFLLPGTSAEIQLEPDLARQVLSRWPNVHAHISHEETRRSFDRTDPSFDSSEVILQSHAPPPTGGIESTLDSYKTTIRKLLVEQYFPGVSSEHFESFKAQFRTTAFTCRSPLCPYASRGFDSLEKCREHEASHDVRLKCEVSGCQYLVFTSRKALTRHMNKHHQVMPRCRRMMQPQRRDPTPKNLSPDATPVNDEVLPDMLSAEYQSRPVRVEALSPSGQVTNPSSLLPVYDLQPDLPYDFSYMSPSVIDLPGLSTDWTVDWSEGIYEDHTTIDFVDDGKTCSNGNSNLTPSKAVDQSLTVRLEPILQAASCS